MLELADLVKHFRQGDGAEPVRAVDGVSISVAPGQFVALYGPSGSGKTTLIELIAGLQSPDQGTVMVCDKDVGAMSGRELSEYRLNTLGMVLQPHTLIPGAETVKNAALKLLLVRGQSGIRDILPLLGELGLGDRLHHTTEQLSMGERQRVLIAVALSTQPRLLLADEPTGHLDTERTHEVLGLLRETCKARDMALLLATHDPDAARFADATYELRDGRLSGPVPADPPLGRSGAKCA